MAHELIFIGNDMLVTLTGLQDEIDGSFVNDATVTATLKDEAGDEVAGQVWPVTLSYITDSDGDYRGQLEDDLELVENEPYYLELTADDGSDGIALWKPKFYALYRGQRD